MYNMYNFVIRTFLDHLEKLKRVNFHIYDYEIIINCDMCTSSPEILDFMNFIFKAESMNHFN